MSFLLAYAAVTVVGLLAASYTDLRERIVPNGLSYGMLALGIILHAAESALSWTAEPLVMSAAGAAIAFVFSLILYKAGAWAGGDVKLFTAIGALLPLPMSGLPAAPVYAYPLFPFMVLINSVVVAFPFIMLYVFLKTLREKKLRTEFKQMLARTGVKALVFAGSLFGLATLLALAGIPQLVALPVLFGIAFLPSQLRYGLTLVLFLAGIATGGELSAFAFLLALGIVVGGFFEALTHGMRALRKEIPVGQLEEGMIAGELVLVEKGKVRKLERSWLQRARLSEPPGTVVSDLSAAGLTPEQIVRLQELGVKKLLVKESIPMIPILLLGCIVSLVVGDLAWTAVSSL